MFKITRNGPNRVDIELSGKLDSDMMQTAVDELIAQSENVEHGRMLFRLGEFALPTLAAIGVEFSHIPALFRMIRRFDKAALIAEQSWIRRVSEIEGALFPGLEIKAFEPDQASDAEAWLDS